MNPSAADKSRLERLLDAGVYAPLGYVLRRDEVKQDLAAAGRKQVAFARSLGQAALKSVGRGVRPERDAPKPPRPQPQAGDAPQPVTEPATEPEPQVTAAAVDGYSTMTAREIIAFMASATLEQASWILAEENAGKQRVTVVRSAMTRLDNEG